MLSLLKTKPLDRFILLSTVLCLILTLPAGDAQADWKELFEKAEKAATDTVKEMIDTNEQQKAGQEESAAGEEQAAEQSQQGTTATPAGTSTATSTQQSSNASATPPAPAPTTASAADFPAGEDLRTIPLVLLEMKYVPETIDDTRMLQMTQRQVVRDQQTYRQADQLQAEKKKHPQMDAKVYEDYDKQLATSMRGVVFKRTEVEGREAEFAARDLMPQFRQRLQLAAASLPDDYQLEYSYTIGSYVYDFEGSLLYNRSNSFWSTCDAIGESCLPTTIQAQTGLSANTSSHLFIDGGNYAKKKDNKRPKNIGDLYLFFPGKYRNPNKDEMMENPHRWPQTILEDRSNISNRGLMAFDRNLDLAPLAMSSNEAEQLMGSDVRSRLRGVIHFSVIDIVPDQYYTTIHAKFQRAAFYGPGGSVLKAWQAGDLTPMAEVVAATNARAESEAATQAARAESEAATQAARAESEAAEQAQARSAEEARLTTRLTILDLKLGMSSAAADQMIRKHMALATVAEYEFPPAEMREQISSSTAIFPYYHKETVYVRDDGLEKITITLSPDESTVSGIKREVVLPESTSVEGLAASLVNKYSKPARQSGNPVHEMYWESNPDPDRACSVQPKSPGGILVIKTLEGKPLKLSTPKVLAFGIYQHNGYMALSTKHETALRSKCGIQMHALIKKAYSGSVTLELTLLNHASYLKLHELAVQSEIEKNPDKYPKKKYDLQL